MPEIKDNLSKGDGYLSSAAILNGNVTLRFCFANITPSMNAKIVYTDCFGKEIEITVSGSEFEAIEEGYAINIDLPVPDVRLKIGCTVYDGSTVIAEATDSIEGCIARMENQEDLAKSLLRFAASLGAYIDSLPDDTSSEATNSDVSSEDENSDTPSKIVTETVSETDESVLPSEFVIPVIFDREYLLPIG